MSVKKISSNKNALKQAVFNISPDLFIRGSNLRLFLLAAGYITFSAVFSALQERVFRIPGFRFGGFMALVTAISYVFCAAIEMLWSKKFNAKGSALNYFFLALTTFIGTYFTNWSLQYISFPVRIIFKSGKLIPVMAVSIVAGKKIPTKLFLNNCSLVLGLALFILGDFKANDSSSSVFGFFLITIGILSDAITTNFEEHILLKKHKTPRAIIICFSNIISVIYSLALSLFTGELPEAFSHACAHPETIYFICLFSFVNYFGVSCVLALLEEFGSVECEVAKTLRKFLSVVISFMLFAKPLSSLHVIGGAIFFSALVYGLKAKYEKNKKILCE